MRQAPLCFLAAVSIVILYGCASVQHPMGGPKDVTPPKVVQIVPKNLSTQFTAKKIVITFDEYFNLKNEFREVTISPEMEKPPILKKIKKNLEVTFEEPLLPNTTYTLNFGNSIADINESNELKNFTYVFSTGSVLDSLQISGKVTNAFTGKPEQNASVFIIPIKADTAFGRKKPAIYARTDSAGRFVLQNLREDIYNLYALQEKNNDRLYLQGEEYVGFLKTPINLMRNVDTINIAVFKEPAKDFKVLERKINPDGTILLTFNRSLANPKISVVSPSQLDIGKQMVLSAGQDSARLWLNDMSFDSLRVAVSENDSVLQSIKLTRAKKETYIRALVPTDNLDPAGNLYPGAPLHLTFQLPITGVDKSKITFLQDSVPQTNFSIRKDSSNILSVLVDYPFQEKKKYEIRFAEGAINSVFDSKNKYFTKRLQLLNSSDFGKLSVAFTLPEKDKQYIFELINESNKTIYHKIISRDTAFTLPTVKNGNYRIKIIYDTNKNGTWDTGNLIKKQFPEQIWLDPRTFTIRPNWEVQQRVNIPK